MSFRLTSLSHGGGCGCKIAPSVLAELLRDSATSEHFPDLLVGTETSDDAAVYRISDTQAVISTTDFFMPIVDDGFDFGQIAATNALSDIYAMGGRPLMALAIVGMPVNTLSHGIIREILRGGEAACGRAGIPIAGGHSIDSIEPIYGLAVTGIVDPRSVKRNSTACAGDLIILGKPLGVGILSAAFKKGLLDDADYKSMIASTTKLNTPGIDLANVFGVHAITDVTGFGLLGHLLEVCRGSGLGARIAADAVPLLHGALDFARDGVATGASARNWNSYGKDVLIPSGLSNPYQALLTDPQTSGGLLLTCSSEALREVRGIFTKHEFENVAVIGEMAAGSCRITVR